MAAFFGRFATVPPQKHGWTIDVHPEKAPGHWRNELEMSGSRPITPVTGDRTSLDALSRTIEGLEARIEGLLGPATTRDPRHRATTLPYAAPQAPARRGHLL